jgi:hypothetical protein
MSDETPTAVVEAEAALSAEALAGKVTTLEKELEADRAEFHGLHAQRRVSGLDDAGYLRYMRLEDQCGLKAQRLEALLAQWHRTHALEALDTAVAHYDAHCAAVVQQVEDGMRLVGALQAWSRTFVALIDEQQRLFGGLTRPSGQPAFDLTSGDMMLQQFLSVLDGGMHLVGFLCNRLIPHLTVGAAEQAADYVVGTRPFSHNLIERYREEYLHASHS